MTGLTISGLHAAHGRHRVLTGVDLTVEDGALACVLGPSGCGKSTLLRVIAGFHPAEAGQVALGGRSLDDGRTRLAAERRNIGYVPQDGALFPHLSVAANVGFGLARAGRRERVREMLELIGLPDLADRHPHQLSGGQQQRVALARALAPRPQLLLLDEPFAALDATLRVDLRTEVAATLRKTGTTAILVTHDQDEALSFADVIAVLREGRTAQTGSPRSLYHQPADAAVARFLGEANLLPAQLRDAHAETAFGRLSLTTDAAGAGPGTVLLRPRQVGLTTVPGPHTVPVRLASCLFRGHDYRLELTPDAGHDLPERLIAYTDAAPPENGHPLYAEAHGVAHAVTGA